MIISYGVKNIRKSVHSFCFQIYLHRYGCSLVFILLQYHSSENCSNVMKISNNSDRSRAEHMEFGNSKVFEYFELLSRKSFYPPSLGIVIFVNNVLALLSNKTRGQTNTNKTATPRPAKHRPVPPVTRFSPFLFSIADSGSVYCGVTLRKRK